MAVRQDQTAADRIKQVLIQLFDAIVYAVWFTLGSGGVVVLVSAAIGGDLVTVKHLLFVWGFSLMAYATMKLWPSSPEDTGPEPPRTDAIPKEPDQGRFQRLIRQLPPLRWIPVLEAQEQYSRGTKLFLSSIFVLAASITMEIGFGI